MPFVNLDDRVPTSLASLRIELSKAPGQTPEYATRFSVVVNDQDNLTLKAIDGDLLDHYTPAELANFKTLFDSIFADAEAHLLA